MIVDKIAWFSDMLEPYLTFFGVLGMWVLFYVLIGELFKYLNKNQKEKRKRVLAKINEIKEPFRQKDEIMKEKKNMEDSIKTFFSKWDTFVSNKEKWESWKTAVANLIAGSKMIEAIRFEKHMENEEIFTMQRETKQIAKSEKYIPMLSILNFVFRIFIFICLLHYYYTVDSIPNPTALVLITTIVSFLATVTRKTFLLFFILALISLFVYGHFSGAACVFILVYWSMKGILFRGKQIKDYYTKKGKEDTE